MPLVQLLVVCYGNTSESGCGSYESHLQVVKLNPAGGPHWSLIDSIEVEGSSCIQSCAWYYHMAHRYYWTGIFTNSMA